MLSQTADQPSDETSRFFDPAGQLMKSLITQKSKSVGKKQVNLEF